MKKDKGYRKYIILLTLFFVIYYLLITRFGQYIYGSTLDWNYQHYTIPDYFRKLFYETGNLFPSFAPHLGAGQNIYNFSYYGLLNPIILLSYLLPFVSMKTYIQISSLVIVYISIILFYKWIHTKVDHKVSLVSSLLFMLATPLLFHSHRHIMFINYMPFLIMGLIGVDQYFSKKKKSLLILSVFLTIMTSYFFSVGAILCLVIYGVYVYLTKNSKLTLKTFIKDGTKFIIPILIGILMAFIILLPTLSAVLGGRNLGGESINYFQFLLPNFNKSDMLYYTYSLGLTCFAIFSLIYIGLYQKWQYRFLTIILTILLIFPIFNFMLNGGMYLNGKVMIPFLPLYVLVIAFSLQQLFKKTHPFKASIGIFLIIGIWIFLRSKSYIFMGDFIITLIALFTFRKTKKEHLLILPIVLIAGAFFIRANWSDSLVKKQFRYYDQNTITLLEELYEKNQNVYRVSNRIGGLGTANTVINIHQYQSSIYSSLSNQDYQNFYYNLIGNEIQNRSRGQLPSPKNLLFNLYMGSEFMLDGEVSELGYEKISEEGKVFLYKNQDVLPIAYASNRLMSSEEFDQLTYPYNAEALLNYIVVDQEDVESNFQTKISEVSLDYKIEDTRDLEIQKTDDTILINAKQNSELILRLNNPLRGKVLLISFDLVNTNSCSVGDQLISINRVVNKLSCQGWKYDNNNRTFEFTIAEENLDLLRIKFDEGDYQIKNIHTFVIDYDELISSYQKFDALDIDTKKTKGDVLEGNIEVSENGYFHLSIPYDQGFTILVDGKEIYYEKTDKAFIGFPIKKGTHHIKVIYQAPLLKISKSISITGFLLFFSILYIEQGFFLPKKVPKNKQNNYVKKN